MPGGRRTPAGLECKEVICGKLNDPTWYALLRGVSGSVNAIILIDNENATFLGRAQKLWMV